MKLYGHDTSPYVRRARALLLELDLPFDRDLGDWVTPSAAFLEASPVGKVPALTVENDGAPLTLLDSKTIATFLLERHAPKLAGNGELPFQATLFSKSRRYEDENVLTVVDAALDAAIGVFIFERDGLKRESAPYLLRQAARIDRCFAWLDHAYAGRGSLHDGAFAYVDLALAGSLDWLAFRNVKDFSSYANLSAFYERSRNRRSLAQTDPRGPR